ncbi:hypothetical protein AMTRI_Chr01g112730 [Amborella trichopoda]
MSTGRRALLSLSAFFFLCCYVSLSHAQSFRPKALVVPVKKDPATLQYLITLHLKTPLQPETLTLDLGGAFLWLECGTTYTSSSYQPILCRRSQCSIVTTGCARCYTLPGPGCAPNRTCGVVPSNPFIAISGLGGLLEDVLAIRSTDGRAPGIQVTTRNYLFSCAPSSLTKGLAPPSHGIAGLGNRKISLSAQLATKFSFRPRFGLCLSGSSKHPGVLFFGQGPYMLRNLDASKVLTYTPIVVNPFGTAAANWEGEPSSEYFIKVKGINIEKKAVELNTTLLEFYWAGRGGTKISTAIPYTMLEVSIYKAVTAAFVREAALMNLTRVAGVKPFGVCLSPEGLPFTLTGAIVPEIELVLDNGETWPMYGSNTMVEMSNGALCLGVLDEGPSPLSSIDASITIGGHQIEDNMLEFDLGYKRLGFSTSLFRHVNTCGDFKF